MIFAIWICILLCLCNGDTAPIDSRYPLPVLLLLPYPESRPNSGWDRGLELIPAARVAVGEVNNHTDILPGYKLQLIERRSDGCGLPLTTEGVLNFVDGVFHRGTNRNVLAILGLACSTVTTAVSPIAGREEVSLIQLAIANSDSLKDLDRFPHLWRIISAASVNINAALSLMESFNWTRVGLIYDGAGVFFRSSADVFRSAITSNKKYTLLLDQSIDEHSAFIESAIDLVRSNGVRIIFVSATVPEAKKLMCEAAKRNVIWPGYVWIFHSRTSEELFDPTCDVDNLNKAIENVTLIDLSLQDRQENETLVSGLTYKEYLEAYDRELENVRSEYKSYLTDFSFANNPFSNPMYDEVWALALALNASLPELESMGLSLKNYQYNMLPITRIIERHLRDTVFEGAVGTVRFNSNQEVTSPIAILQVRNGQSVLIGRYNESINNLTLLNISQSHVPGDDFEKNYYLIDHQITIVFFTLSGIAILFTTVLVCLMILLYNSPQIRATSPILSLLIYTGCYLLIFDILVIFIRQSYQLQTNVFGALCILDRWLVHSGYGLVLSTIIVKLVRVYFIFTRIKKLGRFWRDKYLVLYSVILCLPLSCVHIIWFSIDPLSYQPVTEIRNDINPPTIVVIPVCTSTKGYGSWFEAINIVYLTSIILCILVFALRTRKVNYKNFKDTKKIIIFSYFIIFMYPIIIALWITLRSLHMVILIAILFGIADFVIAMAIQCLLFVPKIIPGARFLAMNKETKLNFKTCMEINDNAGNMYSTFLHFQLWLSQQSTTIHKNIALDA